MKKPKPIFTVGIPDVDQEGTDKISKQLSFKMPDYHVVVYSQRTSQDVIFKVLNPNVSEETVLEMSNEIKVHFPEMTGEAKI